VKAGEVFRVKYPFVRCEVDVGDPDPEGQGFATISSWKPGVEFVACGPYGEDAEAICHAEGEMILTVVDVFKPGRFPTRVFYTRQWVSPERKAFGKGGLHIATAEAFKRRATKYMHEYRIEAPAPGSSAGAQKQDEKNSAPGAQS
jgi:hypothetical protein